MSSDSRAHAAEASAADPEQARRAALCPSERADAVAYDWTQIGVGIVVAGGAYPIVVGAIIGGTWIVFSILSGFEEILPDAGIGELIAFVMWSVAACLCGMMWSLFIASLTLPVVYFVARTLALRTSIVRLGAFSGGLVGLICTLPLSLEMSWYSFPADVWELILYALAGLGLATVLGQLGGAWGGNRSRAAGHRTATARWHPFDPALLPPSPAVEPSQAPDPVNAKFQFGIRHLLWLSVWLSLLLALIRVCGIPYELILPLLMGWTAFQAGAIWIGERLARRIAAWRESRDASSLSPS
jgi:hypothetical protein